MLSRNFPISTISDISFSKSSKKHFAILENLKTLEPKASGFLNLDDNETATQITEVLDNSGPL